ncbi:hypothetical protein [Anatilimnocola floriformis]|uniref:hypothetical protein n=1 Tax=Anatilimnocola floriformis TaxID=2948575 RepID=UPI0020C3E803|nr:hypothetical protein [Anatilimnocola floriformis]
MQILQDRVGFLSTFYSFLFHTTLLVLAAIFLPAIADRPAGEGSGPSLESLFGDDYGTNVSVELTKFDNESLGEADSNVSEQLADAANSMVDADAAASAIAKDSADLASGFSDDKGIQALVSGAGGGMGGGSAFGIGPMIGSGLALSGTGTGGSTGKGKGLFGSSSMGMGGSSGSGGGGGGRGLLGSFYDFKQDRKQNKLNYGGSFEEYIRNVNSMVASDFAETITSRYYKADTQLSYSQLMIPANTSANEGPAEFDVAGKVEPRGWMVHFSGTVIPPAAGEYRFVGFFDDMLLVYVNKQPVLDGSWVPMCNVGTGGSYDQSLRQDFGGPGVSGNRTAYAGKWFGVKGPTRIDILIGETPGGLVGGLLMCQSRTGQYETRSDGTPILPLFATSTSGSTRIRQDPFAQAYRLAPKPPIWKPVAAK